MKIIHSKARTPNRKAAFRREARPLIASKPSASNKAILIMEVFGDGEVSAYVAMVTDPILVASEKNFIYDMRIFNTVIALSARLKRARDTIQSLYIMPV